MGAEDKASCLSYFLVTETRHLTPLKEKFRVIVLWLQGSKAGQETELMTGSRKQKEQKEEQAREDADSSSPAPPPRVPWALPRPWSMD